MEVRTSKEKTADWTKAPLEAEAPSVVVQTRGFIVRKYYALLETILKPLVGRGISPNVVSVVSLAAAVISASFYSQGAFFTGGILLLFTGFIDTLDGTIARLTGSTSRFGALLDSTLDRYAEFFVFFGLLSFYRQDWVFHVILLAMMGSVMVSYIKARSQSLGATRSVGLMQRPERLILLIAGSLLNPPIRYYFPVIGDGILISVIALLAVSSNITALRRLNQGKKDLK